jgi:signal transduction histidine kinase
MNFRPNLNSITTRLILLGIAILILSALGRIFVLTDYLRGDINELSTSQLLTLANYVAKDIDNNLVDRRKYLERVAAQLPLALLNNPRRLQEWLGERNEIYPVFTLGISVFDASGTARVNYPASPNRVGISYSDRDYFQQAMKGEFAVGRPIIGRAIKVPMLPMATPLRDSSGKVRAVLVGLTALDNQGFLESLNKTHVGTGGGLLLISPRDKLFVGASDAKMVLKPTPREGVNTLHDRAMNGYRGTGITVNAFGIEELVGIASVPSTGWFVVARIPTSEAFISISRMHNFIFKSTLIILPFFILILAFGVPYLLRPLTRSAQYADRMTLGEIPLDPLPVVRNDEVGHLTTSFNRLLSKLLESSAKLEINQRELQLTLESVRTSETLLRESQIIAGLGSYVFDVSSGMWESSDVLDKIFGISESYERSIEGWAALIFPDDKQMLVDYLKIEVIGQGKDFDKVYRIIRHNDKEVRWLHGLGKLELDDHGHPLRLRGTIQDISEEHLAQQQLREAKEIAEQSQMEAENANIAKSRFLAAVSHDLRQPLHAQGLFLGALALTKLDPHQLDILANATAASQSSIDMLSTLLDFSRIEAGVIEPDMQSFLLQPLLNNVEREFEPQADDKGICYRSRETELVIHSDPMLLERIIRNLVSNAIRYTKHGGVLIACRKRRSKAVLEVWDTGIGIATEHQQIIFREFLQLSNPERDREPGTNIKA